MSKGDFVVFLNPPPWIHLRDRSRRWKSSLCWRGSKSQWRKFAFQNVA